MVIECIGDLKKELDKYPDDMKVYYATKYALIPLTVKQLDEFIAIDMLPDEKDKYKEW